jgi:hypothetical protein
MNRAALPGGAWNGWRFGVQYLYTRRFWQFGQRGCLSCELPGIGGSLGGEECPNCGCCQGRLTLSDKGSRRKSLRFNDLRSTPTQSRSWLVRSTGPFRFYRCPTRVARPTNGREAQDAQVTTPNDRSSGDALWMRQRTGSPPPDTGTLTTQKDRLGFGAILRSGKPPAGSGSPAGLTRP